MESNNSVSILRMSRATRSSTGGASAAINRRRIVSEPANSLHNLLGDEFRDGNLSIVLDGRDNSFFWPIAEPSGESSQANLVEKGDGNSMPGRNPYCDVCDKLADKPDRLRQHLAANHHGGSIIIDFECDHCGKTFASKTQLNRHVKTHQAESNRKDSESSSLSPPSAAQTPSKRGHKDQGEKRFQCLQCSKRFPTSKDLKRHDVVHTGNREFQCSFCSHRFGRKDHRMRHEKKTHAAELQQLQLRQQQSSSPKQLSPPLPAPPLIALSQPPPLQAAVSLSPKSRTTRAAGQRWRHMSSPSTFRQSSSPGGAGGGGATFLAEIKMEMEESEVRPAANVVVGKDGVIVSKASDIVKEEVPDVDCNEEPPIVAMMHDRSYGILRIMGQEESAVAAPAQQGIEDDNMNGDLDTLLSDMMNGSPVAAADDDGAGISEIDQDSLRKREEAAGGAASYGGPTVPIAGGYQTGMFSKSQMISEIGSKGLASAMTLESNPMMTSVASSAPSTSSGFKCPPPKLLSDTFTRTKNPVLPSVYIDNSLIVPEPAKQKYHSPHHSLLFESDFMDIDSFLL